MKRKNKMFLCLTLIMISTIVLVGCGMSTAQRENKLKKLLRDKYGEEFEVREIYANEYVEAWCYPVDDSTLPFSVKTENDMKSIMMDDYVQRLVERQIDDSLQEKTEEVFSGGFVSTNFFIASTSDYPVQKKEDINLEQLRKYAESKGLLEDIVITVFSDCESVDINKEYAYISEIEELYRNDELPNLVFQIYMGDDQFIDQAREAISKFGWGDFGSPDRTDIWDVVDSKKKIAIYFRDECNPYINNIESGEKLELNLENYTEIRMEDKK